MGDSVTLSWCSRWHCGQGPSQSLCSWTGCHPNVLCAGKTVAQLQVWGGMPSSSQAKSEPPLLPSPPQRQQLSAQPPLPPPG